jgi:hypothetical protein
VPGQDIRINGVGPQAGDVAPGCNVQNEVSLAAHGETVVAAWNDAGACDRLIGNQIDQRSASLSLNGYAWSVDGGPWDDKGTVDPIPGGNLRGDPVLAAGPDGTFYYASIGRAAPPEGPPLPQCEDPASGRFGESIISVARSNNMEQRFETPVVASAGRSPCAFHDKPWLAVDRSPDSNYFGRVYVAWTEIAEDGTLTMLVSRSTDRAASFETPVAIPTTGPNANALPYLGIQLAVGPFGEVYALWTTSGPAMVISRSMNGGETFAPVSGSFLTTPRVGHIQDACLPDSFIGNWVMKGDIRVHNWPAMAVDISGSSDPFASDYNKHRGRISVAVPASRTEWTDEGDIAFIYSEDGGSTWTNIAGPRPTFWLNMDQATGGRNDQFHPSIAVDDEGNVLVSWYDRRNGDEEGNPLRRNWYIDVYARVSADGGQTFGPEIKVSDQRFPPAQNNPQSTPLLFACYMGEYNAVTAVGPGRFLLAWGDNRETDPYTGLPDPNVYSDIVSAEAPPGPPAAFPGKGTPSRHRG